MRIAAIQSEIAWEDPKANFASLSEQVRAAAVGGAKLVVLPEMFSCGFSMNTAAIQEPVDGPSAIFLRESAAEHGVWIGGSIPEIEAGAKRPHNTFILASPSGQMHRYRKIHPFSYAKEHEHYDAGDAHVTVDVDGLRVTLFVCYDLRFADEFWATAKQTDLYLVVANWPAPRREHWRALLRARAIENQAYVTGVNRVGNGGGLEYLGDSAIIDPLGRVLVEASSTSTILSAEVDAGEVARIRDRFPLPR